MAVAVKRLKALPSRQQCQSFVQEAVRIASLQHDNVIRLIAVCLRSDPMLIVLELMALGDLKTLLRSLAPKSDEQPILQQR